MVEVFPSPKSQAYALMLLPVELSVKFALSKVVLDEKFAEGAGQLTVTELQVESVPQASVTVRQTV